MQRRRRRFDEIESKWISLLFIATFLITFTSGEFYVIFLLNLT